MRVGRRRPNPRLGLIWYVAFLHGYRVTGFLDEMTAHRIAREENAGLGAKPFTVKQKRPGAEAPRR